jgi:hypothetical protein
MATRYGQLPCLRHTRGGRSARAATHSSYTTTRDVTVQGAHDPVEERAQSCPGRLGQVGVLGGRGDAAMAEQDQDPSELQALSLLAATVIGWR